VCRVLKLFASSQYTCEPVTSAATEVAKASVQPITLSRKENYLTWTWLLRRAMILTTLCRNRFRRTICNVSVWQGHKVLKCNFKQSLNPVWHRISATSVNSRYVTLGCRLTRDWAAETSIQAIWVLKEQFLTTEICKWNSGWNYLDK
jgi:hypothetical protein